MFANWRDQAIRVIGSVLFDNPRRVVHHMAVDPDGTRYERSDRPAPLPRLTDQRLPPERTCLQTAQFVHHLIIPPGERHVYERHVHPDAEELIIIFQGTGRMTIDEEVRPVTVGDVAHVPPNAEHELFNNSDDLLYAFLVNVPTGDALRRLREQQAR